MSETTSATAAAAVNQTMSQLGAATTVPEGIDRNQLLQLLASLPQNGMGIKLDANGRIELPPNPTGQFLPPPPFPPSAMSANDPGPSTHPAGPPQQQLDDSGDEDFDGSGMPSTSPSQALGGRRSKGGATMGTEEWTRQRKDNHKEVERRRRGNINEGINELGRIVPNGSGEKAKGAILSRAVQYIHHLKENEARNIEKWTLEKLLMDQAMGDLQNQLEEIRRLWEEERHDRIRAENEVAALKGTKRPREDDDGDVENKRQRTE